MSFDRKAYDKKYYLENKEQKLEQMKAYYFGNKEQISEYQKQYQNEYYQDNKEWISERNKEYAKENKEYIKARKRKWYQNTREQRLEYAKENKDKIKEYHKKWYFKNKEHISEQKKGWRRDNPEKIRANHRKRRALKNDAVGYHTESDILYIYDKQKGKCISCGNKFSYNKMTVDHIQPLSKGGSDFPINVQLLCHSCNSSKGNHHETDYRKFEIDLLRNKSSIRMIFE